MKKLVFAMGLSLAMATSAYADDPKSFKVEAGGGFMSYGDNSSTALLGRANFTLPIVDRAFDIGIEVEAGTAIQTVNEAVGGIENIDGVDQEVFLSIDDFGVQEHMAAFAMFRVPLDSGLGVSVRAGYHKANFSGSRIVEVPALEIRDVESFDIDFEGPAAGLAIEYFIGKKQKNGFRFDLTWHDTGKLDIDGGSTWSSITYMRRF